MPVSIKNADTVFCATAPGIRYHRQRHTGLVYVTREGKGDVLFFEAGKVHGRMATVFQRGVGPVALIGRCREGDWYVSHLRTRQTDWASNMEEAMTVLGFAYVS